MDNVVKPKTRRAKRALENRAPKLVENTKCMMFIKGEKTSEVITKTLKDLYILKKPHAVMYKRKNILRPFEDDTSLEFFSKKSDASMFAFGSHSKKRPHNLVLGRLFDFHILDMVELGIDRFRSFDHFKVPKVAASIKPCLLFSGEPFEHEHEYQWLKSLLIDMFRGPDVLQGLEHILQFIAVDGKILLRSYRVILKKSGCKTPRVELEEIGPSFDFIMKRTKLASNSLFKLVRRTPKAAKAKKKKNMSVDRFGSQFGRVHMERQDFDRLQTRKLKGSKRREGKTPDGTSPKKARLVPTEKS